MWSKKADFNKIAEKYGIDPVIARIMVNRDVPETEMSSFLHPDIRTDLHSPLLMKDMSRSADIIESLIRDNKKIRVFGDYDGDGICSSFILVDGLRRLGGNVSYYLPDREKDGYGLNPGMVEDAIKDGVDAVVTCDNGIAASDAIALAKKNGMTVIVTDHHELPYIPEGKDGEGSSFSTDGFDTSSGIYDMAYNGNIYHIPHADCVVDPHRPDDSYPYPDICGAVVAFKLIWALFLRHYKTTGENLYIMRYLPMAAFATVTDVMPLRNENRCIVKHGLAMMSKPGNTGLDALITASGIDRDNIKAWQIGFILGPCFNASGRIATADKALKLLLETDPGEAIKKAEELISLNEKRKDMTEKGMDKAVALISAQKTIDKVVVLLIPELHESLCGLVAGRIKEMYNRPAIVLCRKDKDTIKGSGRSIEAYDMFRKLTEAGQAYTDNHAGEKLYVSFGGHPMAAGLTLHGKDLQWFRKYLNEHSGLTKKDFEEKVMVDVPMPMSYASPELISELDLLEPFGCGNPKPVFAEKNVFLKEYRSIGKNKQYRKIKFASGSKVVDGISFADGDTTDRELEEKYTDEEIDKARKGKENSIKLSVLYYPEINDFMGNITVQANVQDIKCD